MSDRFVHTVRPRYAEVDQQGVVFNAHWLTFFDEACTRFFEWLGDTPSESFFSEYDLMIVKAVLDEHVDIEVVPTRLGKKSLELTYRASVGERPACTGVITYVSVTPGTHDSVPIPDRLRTRLESTT